MSRSIFGWHYPPGCSGPPDEPDYEQPRCKHCGAFLLTKHPIRYDMWEDSMQCDGTQCDRIEKHEPHKVIFDAGSNPIFLCKRCGKEN